MAIAEDGRTAREPDGGDRPLPRAYAHRKVNRWGRIFRWRGSERPESAVQAGSRVHTTNPRALRRFSVWPLGRSGWWASGERYSHAPYSWPGLERGPPGSWWWVSGSGVLPWMKVQVKSQSGFEGHLMNPTYLNLLATMPRDVDGTIKDIKYIPKHRQQAYWEKWRVWLKEHEQKVWPTWVFTEIARRKAEKKGAVDPIHD